MVGLSQEQAAHQVITTNPTFEVTTANIRGVDYKVFKNVPQTIPALVAASREPQGGGDADYLIFQDERLSYAGFCDEINRMAHVLSETFGIGKDDRVAIAMRNYPELLILNMAIASLGAVTVFINAWWTTEELQYALEDSGASLVFADGPRAERMLPLVASLGLNLIGVRDGETTCDQAYNTLRDAQDNTTIPDVDIAADDDFSIMYSSGTTGHPKGVVLTHRGAINAVFTWLMQAAMAPLLSPPEPDAPEAPRPAVLVVTPLFHVTATHPLFLLSLPAGAKLVMLYKWNAEEAAHVIAKENVTRFLGVPTQSADLMETAKRLGLSLPSLDFLGAGGAKRPPAQVAQLADTFPTADLATGWGMTETNAIGIGMAGDDYIARPNCTGRLYPPIQELRFLDEAGNQVPIGEVGEITVKSPCNMRCYLNKPEATDEVFQDGWLRTGDLGYIDSEGFVSIVDRKKNIIIRGGENIACLDIEGSLHSHPDITEACAFSIPDERLGEIVGAAVQLRVGSTLTQTDLNDFLALHIAKFKIPAQVWFQHSPLPRGATDKIDRRGISDACLKTLS